MTTEYELKGILEGCRRKSRRSQKKLYEGFYGYGMSISLRYAHSSEDAVEVLNDAFLKVFLNIDSFNSQHSFKAWFRKILIHTAIDHYRSQLRHSSKIVPLVDGMEVEDKVEFGLGIIQQEDALPIIQRLPPAYRTVFNLYVMDGFKHHEIARMLGISEGTSKSNLARAKKKLRAWLTLEKANQQLEKKVQDG